MADNRDVAVMRHLLISGLVKGGDDKQMVCEQIKKFREKKDKKGVEKFLANLEMERKAAQASNGDASKTIADLNKLVLTLQARIDKLEADKPAAQTQNNPKTGGQ